MVGEDGEVASLGGGVDGGRGLLLKGAAGGWMFGDGSGSRCRGKMIDGGVGLVGSS